jgi:uncharacterized protein YjbJ (UPF0337 family)
MRPTHPSKPTEGITLNKDQVKGRVKETADKVKAGYGDLKEKVADAVKKA